MLFSVFGKTEETAFYCCITLSTKHQKTKAKNCLPKLFYLKCFPPQNILHRTKQGPKVKTLKSKQKWKLVPDKSQASPQKNGLNTLMAYFSDSFGNRK